MPQTYDDAYVRDALDDQGTIPYPGRTVCYSPDIIPYQSTVVSGPDAFFSGNYGSDVGKPILPATYNNIYVRTKNIGTQPTSGAIYLYWTASSLLLDPNQWSKQSIPPPTSSPTWPGGLPFSANPNALTTGGSAFLWPAPMPPSGYHYCLIAVVQTTRHTINIPTTFRSSLDFANWVASNPAVAWRNVEILPTPPVGQVQKLFHIQSFDPEPQLYSIVVRCDNFPSGATLRISSPDVGPDPFIDHTETITSPLQYPTVTTRIPAEFNSHVVITAMPPAGMTTWPPGAVFTPSFHRYQGPDEEHPLFERLGVLPSRLGIRMPRDAPLVRLGECTVAFSPSAAIPPRMATAFPR